MERITHVIHYAFPKEYFLLPADKNVNAIFYSRLSLAVFTTDDSTGKQLVCVKYFQTINVK